MCGHHNYFQTHRHYNICTLVRKKFQKLSFVPPYNTLHVETKENKHELGYKEWIKCILLHVNPFCYMNLTGMNENFMIICLAHSYRRQFSLDQVNVLATFLYFHKSANSLTIMLTIEFSLIILDLRFNVVQEICSQVEFKQYFRSLDGC